MWEPVAPERAEKAADRLLPLMPGAGHIVHMPGHIYMRVGRYNDAVKANVLAVAADEDYIAQCHAQGMYPLGYYPHNIHFIWYGSSMSGQSSLAIASARKAPRRLRKTRCRPCRRCRDSWSCPTTRWCDSAAGTRCWRSRNPRTSRCTRSARGTTHGEWRMRARGSSTRPAKSSRPCRRSSAIRRWRRCRRRPRSTRRM